MTLYFVGLGLGSLDDITIRGDNILKKCQKIFLESYTSVQLETSLEVFQDRYPNAEVTMAYRELVESNSDTIIVPAKNTNVAFCVIGDPFCATTHHDLYMRAYNEKVNIEVVHNASIMNAIGCTGLQLYRFGQTVSIPFFESNWRPNSYIDKIITNYNANMHTLTLLDIKVREQTVDNLIKRNNIYESPRFMSINQAVQQLNELGLFEKLPDEAILVGVARVGDKTQKIAAGSWKKLINFDFGMHLHSLVICAPALDEMEAEFLRLFTIN